MSWENQQSKYSYIWNINEMYVLTWRFLFFYLNDSMVSTGYWGTEMRYMAVSINTTLSQRVVGYPEGLAAAAAWDAFLETQVSEIHVQLIVQICIFFHHRFQIRVINVCLRLSINYLLVSHAGRFFGVALIVRRCVNADNTQEITNMRSTQKCSWLHVPSPKQS